MLAAIEDEIAVNLVGADHDVVAEADPGQALQLSRLKDAPHRVMGVAEQEERGAVGDRPLETVKVVFVSTLSLGQRHDLADAAGVLRCGEHRRVDGRFDEHLVARRTDRVTRQVEPAHDAREEEYLVRLDAPTVQLGQPLLDHLAEAVRRLSIPKDAVSDALLQRADDRLRRGEIHVGHPQGQHVLVVTAPLDAVRVAAVDDVVKVKEHGESPM